MASPKGLEALVNLLLERLDRFELAVSEVQRAVARIEEAEKQTHKAQSEAVIRMDALEARILDLEETRSEARGAAKGAGLLWKVLGALGLLGAGAGARSLLK